jgi:hypothetical protein
LKQVKLCAALLFACFALMVITMPTGHSSALGGQSTPVIVIITATPSGGAVVAATPEAPAAAGAAAGATQAPREWEAFNLARRELTKKINQNLRYVTNWTWDLVVFPDSALGCPQSGESVLKGDTGGYKITIQPLGSATIYEYRISFDLTKVRDCGKAGSAASGSAAAGGTGPVAAGGFEYGGHVASLSAGTVQRMREAQMTWVKFQVRDGSGPGYIQAAKANGFKVLLGVVGDKGRIMDAAYQSEYAAWAASLAAAGADAIEVWNEQNLDREWPAGNISPQAYTQLLQKTYAAIKAANANTIVISGAPAPTGGAGAGGKTNAFWNDDVYMQEMAAAGAGQYFDCLGLHYNEGIVSPTQASGDPRDSYPTRYFATMLSRGLQYFPGKRACWTELGFLTPQGYDPLPGGFAWAQNVTIAQQAQWLGEAAQASARSNVRLMIVWNVDFPGYIGGDPQAGYAMIRKDGTCPACAALANAIQ